MGKSILYYYSLLFIVLCLSNIGFSQSLGKSNGRGPNMVKPESNKWQKANLGDFFFECPKTLKLGGDRGVDSTVWVFTDERRKLYIETGRYVDVNNEFRGEKYFQEKTLDINGVPGTASYFEFDQKIEDQYQFGSSLLLLKKERIRTNLLMTLFSEDRADKEIAEKIFHSIRIN